MADKLVLDRGAMKDRSTSHLRVYVGGLNDDASIDDLYDHFSPFGEVQGIVVNRGFGFVQFAEESQAQKAITNGHGSVFAGKSLTIRTAQTSTEKRDIRRPENLTTEPDKAVANSDKQPIEEQEEPYDSYGNFIGEQERVRQSGDENEYDNYPQRGGPRGRGPRGPPRGRGPRGRPGPGPPGFREHSPSGRGGDWPERGGYDRFPKTMSDYARPLPVSERNDCEIIVVSKTLTEYAEFIEGRLKRLGIVVDLLYPMEDVPIGRVLGNIASRGCLYAILVTSQNQEHRSLSLTILHGLPQEHRNMPLEDALQLLSRNFQEVQRGGPTGREAVYALLGQLADGRTLTVMQYDKIMEYLQDRRSQQVKIELGEPLTPVSDKKQVDLQQRILSILNDKSVTAAAAPAAPPPPAPPAPAPAPAQNNQLLNDPSVRKALDSIMMKFM